MHERNGAEEARLAATREQNVPWKKWGPYLSERQWGTVREDYSQTGNACLIFILAEFPGRLKLPRCGRTESMKQFWPCSRSRWSRALQRLWGSLDRNQPVRQSLPA